MTQLVSIGDIHGCNRELNLLLDAIDKDRGSEKTKIIFLGDSIDRGPDSKGVIDTLIQRSQMNDDNVKHIFIKGNHDDMMLNDKFNWYRNGGYQTLLSYGYSSDRILSDFDKLPIPAEHINFLKTCRHWYSHEHFVFAHAGIHPDLILDENDPQQVMWNREFSKYNGEYTYGYHVTHGHQPLNNVQVRKHRINIDTGCVFGGPLTAVRYDADRPFDKPVFIEVYEGKIKHFMVD